MVTKALTKSVVIVSIVVLSACTRVPPGYVGIHMSYAGSDRGVDKIPTTTGWVFYNPAWSYVLEYPTFVQTAVWTHDPGEGHPANEEITFTNADQMQIAIDISIAYSLVAEKVPAFYVKFRSEDLQTFTHGFLRNLARDKFDSAGGKYHIEQIMGDNAPFLKEVRDALQKDLEPIGVRIEQFGLIGAPRPPQAVITAINLKAQAQQIAAQKVIEVTQAEADAKKAVAQATGAANSEVAAAEGYAKATLIKAEANAKANKLMTETLSPLLVDAQKVQKWNGILPQVSGATPFITLPQR